MSAQGSCAGNKRSDSSECPTDRWRTMSETRRPAGGRVSISFVGSCTTLSSTRSAAFHGRSRRACGTIGSRDAWVASRGARAAAVTMRWRGKDGGPRGGRQKLGKRRRRERRSRGGSGGFLSLVQNLHGLIRGTMFAMSVPLMLIAVIGVVLPLTIVMAGLSFFLPVFLPKAFLPAFLPFLTLIHSFVWIQVFGTAAFALVSAFAVLQLGFKVVDVSLGSALRHMLPFGKASDDDRDEEDDQTEGREYSEDARAWKNQKDSLSEFDAKLRNRLRISENVVDWTPKDVAEELILEGLDFYADLYEAQRVDGRVLLTLTNDDLRRPELSGPGPTPLGDERRLILFLEKVRLLYDQQARR